MVIKSVSRKTKFSSRRERGREREREREREGEGVEKEIK